MNINMGFFTERWSRIRSSLRTKTSDKSATSSIKDSESNAPDVLKMSATLWKINSFRGFWNRQSNRNTNNITAATAAVKNRQVMGTCLDARTGADIPDGSTSVYTEHLINDIATNLFPISSQENVNDAKPIVKVTPYTPYSKNSVECSLDQASVKCTVKERKINLQQMSLSNIENDSPMDITSGFSPKLMSMSYRKAVPNYTSDLRVRSNSTKSDGHLILKPSAQFRNEQQHPVPCRKCITCAENPTLLKKERKIHRLSETNARSNSSWVTNTGDDFVRGWSTSKRNSRKAGRSRSSASGKRTSRRNWSSLIRRSNRTLGETTYSSYEDYSSKTKKNKSSPIEPHSKVCRNNSWILNTSEDFVRGWSIRKQSTRRTSLDGLSIDTKSGSRPMKQPTPQSENAPQNLQTRVHKRLFKNSGEPFVLLDPPERLKDSAERFVLNDPPERLKVNDHELQLIFDSLSDSEVSKPTSVAISAASDLLPKGSLLTISNSHFLRTPALEFESRSIKIYPGLFSSNSTSKNSSSMDLNILGNQHDESHCPCDDEEIKTKASLDKELQEFTNVIISDTERMSFDEDEQNDTDPVFNSNSSMHSVQVSQDPVNCTDNLVQFAGFHEADKVYSDSLILDVSSTNCRDTLHSGHDMEILNRSHTSCRYENYHTSTERLETSSSRAVGKYTYIYIYT